MPTLIFTTILQAIILFAATNIDHLVLLSLWFVHGRGKPGTTAKIFAGQYLGFITLLGVTIALTVVSGLVLPEEQLRWLGLIPILVGLKAAFDEIRERLGDDDEDEEATEAGIGGKTVSVLAVALVTIANGGDEIGVYLPVFAVSTWWQIGLYCVVFLILAAGLLSLAKYLTGRSGVEEILERFEAILFPSVLIILGMLILLDVF